MAFVFLPAVCTLAVLLCMVTGHALFSRSVHGGPASVYLLPIILLGGFILWNVLFFSLDRMPIVDEILAGYGMFGFIAVGYTELFLNLYRGFSYTIIVDIGKAASITEQSLRENFADGLGEEGMIERRFASMEEAGLIRRTDGTVSLLPHGTFFAHFSSYIRRFLRLEKGGGELPPTA